MLNALNMKYHGARTDIDTPQEPLNRKYGNMLRRNNLCVRPSCVRPKFEYAIGMALGHWEAPAADLGTHLKPHVMPDARIELYINTTLS